MIDDDFNEPHGGGMFGGRTYDEALDGSRLTHQLGQVRLLMADEQWRTLEEISEAVQAPQASVSARLRDLRKPKFGGFAVQSRRVADGGLWTYRVMCWDVTNQLPPPKRSKRTQEPMGLNDEDTLEAMRFILQCGSSGSGFIHPEQAVEEMRAQNLIFVRVKP
jgi:hypothetical protein